MRIFAFLFVAFFLSGCGTFADPTEWFGSSNVAPPAELVELKNQFEPKVLWKRSFSSAEGDGLQLAPLVKKSKVYVADPSGKVSALDALTGKTLWEQKTEAAISAGPGLGDGLVLLGTSDAEVIALEQSSGKQLWRSRVSSEVLAAPAAAFGVVAVHTLDGRLIGLDAISGKERWRYDKTVPVLSLRGSGTPMAVDSNVLCGMSGGRLVSLDMQSGELNWDKLVSTPIGRTELERIADIDGDLLVQDGIVFLSTFQGKVSALGVASGDVIWDYDLSSYNGLAADITQVYVSNDEGKVYALDAITGSARWKNEQLLRRRLSAPAVLREYVVVGDFEGYLHWMSSENGQFVARNRVGSSPIVAPPRSVDGILYVLGQGGDLAAIELPSAK